MIQVTILHTGVRLIPYTSSTSVLQVTSCEFVSPSCVQHKCEKEIEKAKKNLRNWGFDSDGDVSGLELRLRLGDKHIVKEFFLEQLQ